MRERLDEWRRRGESEWLKVFTADGRNLPVHATLRCVCRQDRNVPVTRDRTACLWAGTIAPSQMVLSFQRPRRNSSALAMANVENAIVTAHATPCGPRRKCRASSQASGTSHSQKQNRLSHVGVHVSPAPLNEFVSTMP